MTSISSVANLKTWASSGGTGTLTQNILIDNAADFPLATQAGSTLNGGRYTITIDSSVRVPILQSPSGSITVQELEIAVQSGSNMTTGVLFGDITNNNSVITVTNCAVTGSFTMDSDAAGFVGEITSGVTGYDITVTGCYCTGNISVNGGGIVGANRAGTDGFIKVDRCYSTGDIANGGGGIVGANFGNSASPGKQYVKRCYSTGNIGSSAGGITSQGTGANNGNAEISNCYSTGTIGDDGGGIVGRWADGTININQCYSQHATATGAGSRQFIGSSSEAVVTSIGNEAGNSATWNATLNPGGGGTGLVDNQGPDPLNDIWDNNGTFGTSGFGLNYFQSDPWNSSTYTSNSSEPEFATAGGAGDPHITTLTGEKYDLVTDGVFNLFDNMNNNARLVVNADIVIPDHPIWQDKEYINNVFISYKGNAITINTGFRGKLVRILDIDEDFESDENVKITCKKEKLNDQYKKFCTECRYRTRNTNLLMRHRRKTGHKLLNGVRNRITVTIQDEYNIYNIDITNVNHDNFDPSSVSLKIHDKALHSLYSGGIVKKCDDYDCDIYHLHYINPIETIQ